MAVPGLLGGPPGGPLPPGIRLFEGANSGGEEAVSPTAGDWLLDAGFERGAKGAARVPVLGGADELLIGVPAGRGGTGGVSVLALGGKPLAPLTARLPGGGPPRGGGGVGADGFAASAPAFLFTHFFSSLS